MIAASLRCWVENFTFSAMVLVYSSALCVALNIITIVIQRKIFLMKLAELLLHCLHKLQSILRQAQARENKN